MRVSRSAYYDYHAGRSQVVGTRKAALGEQVRAIFYEHRRRYGSRRVAAELRAEGISAGRQAVRAQMRRLGLEAIRPRRFGPRTTDSRHPAASPNLLLDEKNAPQKPGEVIVGDITYLPLRSGRWGCLASWQDKFTRRVVGWAVEARMTEELVLKAFERAVAAGGARAETIVHTDRGSQYVSRGFRTLLASNGCRQSMSSRRANCYDNAQAESFFSRYKAELLEGGAFADVEQARGETFSYIEGYYNRERRHSALGYKTPEEFEREWEIKTKGESSERVVSGNT
jgi:putative transposase